jgi:hypothetical protein
MSHTLEAPMVRTNAVKRCAAEMMLQIGSVGTTLLGDMQAILRSNLGTADPLQVEFEESSLLVRSIINAETAPHLRETRSAVIAWLCGAPLNEP